MPTTRNPRRGSMQYWHRQRARRTFARVRAFPATKEIKPLAFAGYKVGMTHTMITDNKATSMTKGEDIQMPVTIIECPPLKTASIIFYKKTKFGLKTSSAVVAQKLDKELERRISMPKKTNKNIEDIRDEDYDDLRVLVYTQPKLTTIGKKKPELFEIALSGKKEEKLEHAKKLLGNEISIKEVFNEGQLLDVHAVTKGKGFQGPVKRFGIMLRPHKSEKGVRRPGNYGSWTGPRTWRAPAPGQMGYHQRTEYNKWLIKIGNEPDRINRKGGFKSYGVVKNNYILLKGSIQGAAKRMIIMTNPLRPDRRIPSDAPTIQYLSRE